MTFTDRIRESEQPGWAAGYRCGNQDRAVLEARLTTEAAANSELRNEVRELRTRLRRLTKETP